VTAHSNRHRGLVTLEAGGQIYTLQLTVNAICALEEKFSTPEHDVTVMDLLARVQKAKVTMMRAFIWAALREHHPELTEEDAGRLITAAGGLGQLGATLQTLTESMEADRADLAALGATGRPTPGRNARRPGVPSTGAASISSPVSTD
jgi:hypothetical protein